MQASAGLERDRSAGGVELRVEGYYKRFTDVLIGQLETEAERLARVGPLRLPGGARRQHPDRSAHHDGADQRRPRPRLRLRRVRVAADGAGRRPAARLGQLHLGPGRARRLRAPLRRSSTTAGTRSRRSRRCSSRAAGSWRRRRAWRRDFPRTAPVGLRVAGDDDAGDRDGDGVTDEILPDLDAGRAAGLRRGLRRRRQPERRTPAAVRARRRARHLASARRRRAAGSSTPRSSTC